MKEIPDKKKRTKFLKSIASEEIIKLLRKDGFKEVKKIFSSFFQAEGQEVRKIILAGGSAFMPGLIEYFTKNLQKPTEIANPFTNNYYPPMLEEYLKIMGPAYAIAVGAALRGLEWTSSS